MVCNVVAPWAGKSARCSSKSHEFSQVEAALILEDCASIVSRICKTAIAFTTRGSPQKAQLWLQEGFATLTWVYVIPLSNRG